MPDAGCRVPDAGYRMLDAGCRVPDGNGSKLKAEKLKNIKQTDTYPASRGQLLIAVGFRS